MKLIPHILLIFLISFLLFSCKNKKQISAPPPPLIKKERPSADDKPQKGPIINVTDTVELKRAVLCIKDSAVTATGLSLKLNTIYNSKLPAAILAGKLKITGQPMAWFKSQKLPFFFEAGIPVDKIPVKFTKGTFIKKTGGDSAVVAHFFGPNDLTATGYDALNEILKDRKKKKAAPAYEIYVKNPFAVSKEITDPYKLQTDIVMPYK